MCNLWQYFFGTYVVNKSLFKNCHIKPPKTSKEIHRRLCNMAIRARPKEDFARPVTRPKKTHDKDNSHESRQIKHHKKDPRYENIVQFSKL